MSNDTKAHIHCDGCGAEIVEATKVGAEQAAYVRGWHRLSDGRDICPKCDSSTTVKAESLNNGQAARVSSVTQ